MKSGVSKKYVGYQGEGRPPEPLREALHRAADSMKKALSEVETQEDELLRTNIMPQKAVSDVECSGCGAKQNQIGEVHCEICGDPFCSDCLKWNEKSELLTCRDCSKAL